VRQGEEEARRHQDLIEEIEDLRAQLVLAKQDSSHMSGEGQCTEVNTRICITCSNIKIKSCVLFTGCIYVRHISQNTL
jgi:hypothetical protein